MRWTLPPLLTLLLAAALWNAGEAHRANCQRAARTHCTVLPWDRGHAVPGVTVRLDPVQRDRIRRALSR